MSGNATEGRRCIRSNRRRETRPTATTTLASFKSQQAAGLALKGFLRASVEYVIGHSLLKLLTHFDVSPPEEIVRCSKELDKVYIPSRYPDAYDAGSPMDYYDQPTAQASIDCAARILDWLDARAAD